jgi:hypothetical protein
VRTPPILGGIAARRRRSTKGFIAGLGGILTGHGHLREMVGHQEQGGVQHRHSHALAGAGAVPFMQRGRDGKGLLQASRVVDVGCAHFCWL